MQWKIVDSRKFTSNHEGYSLVVTESGKQWIWYIFKDAIMVDACYYTNHIPTSELDAKVKAEYHLNKLINSNK